MGERMLWRDLGCSCHFAPSVLGEVLSRWSTTILLSVGVRCLFHCRFSLLRGARGDPPGPSETLWDRANHVTNPLTIFLNVYRGLFVKFKSNEPEVKQDLTDHSSCSSYSLCCPSREAVVQIIKNNLSKWRKQFLNLILSLFLHFLTLFFFFMICLRFISCYRICSKHMCVASLMWIR